jgi:hypothetical protein
MREIALLMLAMAASCFGFACLALSMERHREAVSAEIAWSARQLAVLRTIGGLALVVSLMLALLRDGPSFGSLMWVLILTAGAIAVSFTLTWRPHWLRHMAYIASAID